MITRSNKHIKDSSGPTNIIVEDYSVSKGKVLQLPSKYYGQTETNPFDSTPNKQNVLHKSMRASYIYQNRKFEYDFAETNRILDTEAFVAAIFRKKKALILRNNPLLKSKSDRNADYVQKRLAEMEYVSGVLFNELLETVVESLVNYNNVFILIHRNEFSSTGLIRDDKKPVAALFILSPTRLHPIVNDNGDIVAYSYRNKVKNQQPLIINKEDIYHIYTDKKIDVSVGTPPLEAVKDDIQSLRQLEESIENLVYKHASPLLHIKVGNNEHPASRLPDGTSEIDYYNSLAQHMENEGGLTTSHRVNIDLIGAESHALRAESTIEYFKQRVVSGLKASLLDLGEANSISTAGANAISKVLKQDVEAYQKVLERFFTNRIFNDLLLESKWYINKARVPKDEEVELKIQEADIEDRIKVESHLANLVRYGLMSPEDFSRETGRQVPESGLTLENNSDSIPAVAQTGAFSTITTPQNQHSDNTYEVLDSLINSPEDKRLAKSFFFVQDSLSDWSEKDQVELSKKLSDTIDRYTKQGVDSSVISDVIQEMMIQAFLKEQETI